MSALTQHPLEVKLLVGTYFLYTLLINHQYTKHNELIYNPDSTHVHTYLTTLK